MTWSLIERWGSQVLASGVFVVLAREVTPRAFGLVALAGVFVAFANVFLAQGFAQAIIAQRPLRKDHVDTAFWANAGMGAVLAAIGISFAPLIARIQGDAGVRPVLQALSVDFLLGALGGIPEAMLQRELRFRQLSIRTLVSNVIADVFGVALAVAGAGVWALVVQTLAQTAIDTAILWVVSPQRPGMHVTKVAFKDMRRFGLNVTGLNILNLFNRQSDNFLIGVYLGAAKLGIYSIAYQILNLFEDAFVNTTQVVMFPVFASVANDRKRLERAFEMASRVTAMLAFPAFVGLAMVSSQMIPLVFGHRWHSAVPVAEVLSGIGIVHAVTQFNGQVCKAVGKAGIVLKFTLLNTVVNVAGFFVAVHYGIFWVAVAYVARGWLLYPLSVVMVRMAVPINVRRHLLGFVPPAIAVGAMAGVVALFTHETHTWPAWPRLLATVIIGIAVYAPVLWLVAGGEIETLIRTLTDARKSGVKRQKGAARRAALQAALEAEQGVPVSVDDAAPAEEIDDPGELASPVPGMPGHPAHVELAMVTLRAQEGLPGPEGAHPLDQASDGPQHPGGPQHPDGRDPGTALATPRSEPEAAQEPAPRPEPPDGPGVVPRLTEPPEPGELPGPADPQEPSVAAPWQGRREERREAGSAPGLEALRRLQAARGPEGRHRSDDPHPPAARTDAAATNGANPLRGLARGRLSRSKGPGPQGPVS